MVTPWPIAITDDLPGCPAFKKRPCDYGLDLAIMHLETQLGSYEAYNRVIVAALALKAKIEAGDGKIQNACYANPQ